MLKSAIGKTFNDDQFWAVLLNESVAQSGPFDGGCLICAKAIQLAVDDAELVRIVSDLNGGQTEHYGIRLDDSIYDMDGIASSEAAWVSRFQDNESRTDRVLGFAAGYDEESLIPDDPCASKQISQILFKYLVNPG
jgi:hypothetical protein